MYGLGPGIALGSIRVYRSKLRDPQTSSFSVLPGVPQRWTHHVLTHRSFTLFHIWFRKPKYFNILLLISTGKNVHACTSNIHQDGDSKEKGAKRTSPGGDFIRKAKTDQTCKKGGYAEQKLHQPPKKHKNSRGAKVAATKEKRENSTSGTYLVGRARIWTTRRTASADRSAQLDCTRKCPPARI